ncbi:hypothetical protein BGC_04560 [Burkholderia sp. 3C]
MGGQPREERAIARPQQRIVPRGQMRGKRGAPRTGAENSNFHRPSTGSWEALSSASRRWRHPAAG